MLFSTHVEEASGRHPLTEFRDRISSCLFVAAHSGPGRYVVSSDCGGITLRFKLTGRSAYLLLTEPLRWAAVIDLALERMPVGQAVLEGRDPGAGKMVLTVSDEGGRTWRSQRMCDSAGSGRAYRELLRHTAGGKP